MSFIRDYDIGYKAITHLIVVTDNRQSICWTKTVHKTRPQNKATKLGLKSVNGMGEWTELRIWPGQNDHV